MKISYSESQDESLPPEVTKLIHDLNERCERSKDHLIKIKKYTQIRDIELKHVLMNLGELHRIICRDLEGSDDWSRKSFEEIVSRPIGELNEMVKCYIDVPPTNSLVSFHKIYDMTQEVIERIKVFKFSSLNRKRDQLDSLFQLPDADRD
jgi:hypothetical protein